MKAMDLVLSKARERLYSCKLVTEKLRAMLQSADEQVRTLKKQSTFLSQLAAKTIPNGLHCLSMRLTIDYYLLPPKSRKFPRSENLENPNLYHYALFSDNVLAASVVVNSTIMNAKVWVGFLLFLLVRLWLICIPQRLAHMHGFIQKLGPWRDMQTHVFMMDVYHKCMLALPFTCTQNS